MADTPNQPDARDDDKSLYGDHASGRYGDQAYGLVVPAAAPPAAAGHDGTNAQVVGGAPSGTAGADDERRSPGISTDKKSDDTKPDVDA